MGAEQYRVVIRFDEENKQFVAEVPELPLMTAVTGESRADVMSKLDEAMEAAIKLTIEQNGSLPKAIDEDDSLNGELTISLGKTLHRELAFKAKKEGLDLDKAIIAALSAYAYNRRSYNNFHKNNDEKRDENVDGNNKSYENRRYNGVPREGSDAYRTLMDDGASFREYLRQQERSARPQRNNRSRRPRNNNGENTSSNNEQ